MNKRWAIWLILFPNLLLSQVDYVTTTPLKESYRGYVGISLGPSFPFGAFEQTDVDLIGGGYANTGFSFNVDFGYRFYKNLLLAGHYLRINNSLDKGKILDKNPSICFRCNPIPSFSELRASKYELNTFFAGLGFIKEQPNFSFQMQFMLAYANMYTPNVELSHDNETFVLSSNSESGLGYAVGSGLRIHLTEQLDFSTFGTFIIFQENFVQEYSYKGETTQLDAAIRYQVFNLTFGLSYRIIKKEDEPEPELKY